jgi:UrcA family protein
MNIRRILSSIASVETPLRAAALATWCIAPAAVVIVQQPSFAAQTSSAKVSLAGIDLNTPEGRDEARHRLHSMARTVCGRVAEGLDLSHQSNFVKCVDDTVEKAMQQIDNPVLATDSRPKTTVPQLAAVTETSTVKLSLADLDLSTPAGAQAAQERLHAAARLACSRLEDSLDLGRQPHFVECVDSTMAGALPQVEALARKSAPAHAVASN